MPAENRMANGLPVGLTRRPQIAGHDRATSNLALARGRRDSRWPSLSPTPTLKTPRYTVDPAVVPEKRTRCSRIPHSIRCRVSSKTHYISGIFHSCRAFPVSADRRSPSVAIWCSFFSLCFLSFKRAIPSSTGLAVGWVGFAAGLFSHQSVDCDLSPHQGSFWPVTWA